LACCPASAAKFWRNFCPIFDISGAQLELRRGRNLTGWSDLEERLIFSVFCIFSAAKREKSLVFRKERETDVEDNHKVLDLRVSYSTDQGKSSFILQRVRRTALCLCFTSVLQHGWDVWMLQGKEVSFTHKKKKKKKCEHCKTLY